MANSNREAIIELGGRIATLRAQSQRIKQELRAAESELDKLLAGPAPQSPVEIPLRLSDKLELSDGLEVAGEVSLNQKIIQIIDAEPDRKFDTDEVLARLGDANETSVRSALARLASQGKICKPLRGNYTSTHTEARSVVSHYDRFGNVKDKGTEE